MRQRYRVYHHEPLELPDGRFRSFTEGAYEHEWPGPSYRLVATVEAESLGEVFGLTQHLDTPWTDLPRVHLTADGIATLGKARERNPQVNSSFALRIRSTSVGDVIVAESTGYAHGVAGIGFAPLGDVRTGVRMRLAELRGSEGADYNRVTALQDWSADHTTGFTYAEDAA